MNKIGTYWKEFTRYLTEVWIEVRPHKGRVVWPNMDGVKLSTKVVIISSIGVGLFIGLLDYIFAGLLKMLVGGGHV